MAFWRRAVLALPLLCCLAGQSGEKHTLILPGKYKNYEIPAVIIAGKSLAIVAEKGDLITYATPFESRSSACALRVGGDAIAGGAGRLVKNYPEFCRLKMAMADDDAFVASGSEVGDEPFEKTRIVHEDRTSIVYTSRWREGQMNVFGIEAVTLAYDLPMRLVVMMRDRADAGRERELERSFVDWTARVAKANQRLPQEVDVVLDSVAVAVPFPRGYDRFYHGGTDSYGWFAASPATGRPGTPESVLEIPRLPEPAKRAPSPAALADLSEEMSAEANRKGGEAVQTGKGERHFALREQLPGMPEVYYNFLLVKSRLLVLSFRGRAASANPTSILAEWRKDTFKNNGEVPE